LAKTEPISRLLLFYGSLAEPGRLARLLDLPKEPTLSKATVNGAVITTRGVYMALVDGPVTAVVGGWAYHVMNAEHEDELLRYETDAYEVVRCRIHMDGSGQTTHGLTFRFVGW
jgi:hypothetical protein